tara:strand:- start:36 stop:4442 length:4407 start_codon:yes stop_codon:yes gene_type:complete
MDKQKITLRGQEYETDVNLGLAFENSGISQDMIANKLQEQHENSENYNNDIYVSRDLDDVKESYSYDEYVDDVRKSLSSIYSQGFLTNLSENQPKEYGKFFYKHLYDGVDKNPRLEQHFRKHYPDSFKQLVSASNKYNIEIGRDTFDRPIYANVNYNKGDLFENPMFNPKPFDDISIAQATKDYERGIRLQRALYQGIQEGPGTVLDIVLTPRKLMADMFEKYGKLIGTTPQGFARWLNRFDKLNLIRKEEEFIPITDDLTYVDIFTSTDSITASDKATAWLAKNVPWLGLTPPPEGEEPDRMFMIPGAKPFGVDLSEELMGGLSAVLTGRMALEGTKQVVRRSSKFATGRGFSIDKVATQKSIESQRNSGGISRVLGGLRQGGLDTSNNLVHTIKSESAMVLGGTLAVTYVGDWATKVTGQEEPGLGNLGVNFTVGAVFPLLAVAVGKPLAGFTYDKLEGLAPTVFRGELADLSQAIRDGTLPKELQKTIYGQGKVGRKTYIEIGRTLQTLRQNDPETFDVLFDGFKNFKREKENLRKGLLDNGIESVEVEKILNDITAGQSAAWSLGLFEGAKQQFADSGFLNIRKSLLARNTTYKENLENAATMKLFENGEIKAEKAYGEALFGLSNRIRKAVDEGKNVPEDLLTTVKILNKKYLDILLVPEKNAANIKRSLENVYDIKERFNAKTLTDDGAVVELQNVMNTLNPEEKGYFSALLRQYQPEYNKDFNTIIGKLDEVQDLINFQKERVNNLYSNLKDSNILDEANQLSVKKPKLNNTKQSQLTILKTAYNNITEESTTNYTKALAGKAGDVDINTIDIADKLLNLLELGPEFGGFQGRSEVNTVLLNLSTTSPALKELRNIYMQKGRNLDITDANPEREAARAQSLDDLIKNVKNLSLRDAVAIRSELGKKSAKALNSGDRSTAYVASKLHEVFDEQIQTDMPKDVAPNLKKANDYYRDNVAGIFFDRYSRAALNAGTDDGIPFKNFFNRNILQNNVNIEDSVGRRSQYEVMFPEGSKLRAQADAEIKNIMALQLFGTKTQSQMTTDNFVTQLRQKIEDPKHPLFNQEEGFLDIFLNGKDKADQFVKTSYDTPMVGKNGKIEGGSFERLNNSSLKILEGDFFFDSNNLKANREAIGSIVNDMARLSKQRKEDRFSPYFKVLVDTAQSGNKSVDVGNSLVQTIRNSKGQDSINTYQGLVDAVKQYGGSELGIKFEAMLKYELSNDLMENLGIRYVELDQPGVELVNSPQLQKFIAQNKELYAHVYGPDFDPMKSIVKLSQMASTKGGDALTAFGGELKSMSDSAALSRAWGVARGVVSIRYVASEFLLRAFASKNNDVILKVLSTPGFAEAVMEGVDSNKFKAFKPSLTIAQKIIPALAGALTGDDYTPEKYEENYRQLKQFYEDSKQNNTDFIQGLGSLIFLARNEEQRNRALENLALETAKTSVPQITPEIKRDLQSQMRGLGIR